MTLSKSSREKLNRRGTLELRDASLAEALYIVSKRWEINIVVGNDIKGSINGQYQDAPLDEILRSMLDSRGYGYKAIGDSLVIMKLEDIGDWKYGFEVEQISLKEVPPAEVVDLIALMLSPNGRAHGVESAKSIVVIDYPERIKNIRVQLEALDGAAGTAKAEEKRKTESEKDGGETSSTSRPSGWLDNALRTVAESAASNAQQGQNTTNTDQATNQNDPEFPSFTTDTNTNDTNTTGGEPTEDVTTQQTELPDTNRTTQADVSPAAAQEDTDIDTGEIGNILSDLQGDLSNLQGGNSAGGGGGGGGGSSAGSILSLANADLSMAVFRPQFVNAAEIVDAMGIFVSEIGQVSVVDTENRLVAVDLPRNIAMMRRAIEMLDVPRGQVRISSLIFDASMDDLYRVGVNWNSTTSGRNLGPTNVAQDSFQLNSLTAANPAAGATNGAMTFMSLSRNFNVNTIVNALTTSNRSKLVASPSIVVKDRESGRFAIVTEIPYQELTEGLEGGSIGTTAFREAGVTLEVTPSIANDGTIDMIITPVFSVLSGFTPGDNQPIIDRREATTTVRISNGQTFVLAGLRQRSRVNERAGIPYLRDIRFIGDLFKHKNNELEDNELIVFVTPEVVGTDALGNAREYRAMQDGTYEMENVPESANAARCNPEDQTLQSNQFYGTGRINTYNPQNAPTVQQFRYNAQENANGGYEVPYGADAQQPGTARDRSAELRYQPERPIVRNDDRQAASSRRNSNGMTEQTFRLSNSEPPANTAAVVHKATPIAMVPFKPKHRMPKPPQTVSRRTITAQPNGMVRLGEPTTVLDPSLGQNPRTSRRQETKVH
jgi:type II secretory pathway component GspD/PulD (secretin)